MHPNIVKLYDVFETDRYIGIIMEYASGKWLVLACSVSKRNFISLNFVRFIKYIIVTIFCKLNLQ